MRIIGFGCDSDLNLTSVTVEEDGREYRFENSRWISVEDDRKPKHHEEVLCRYVFDGDSECFYAVLTYYAYGDNGYVTGPHFTGEGLHDMRVTHWMPLPEAPKESAK